MELISYFYKKLKEMERMLNYWCMLSTRYKSLCTNFILLHAIVLHFILLTFPYFFLHSLLTCSMAEQYVQVWSRLAQVMHFHKMSGATFQVHVKVAFSCSFTLSYFLCEVSLPKVFLFFKF